MTRRNDEGGETEAQHRLAMLRGVPGLTAAQAEALALLLEECAEVIAIVGKALRHGLDSCHPDGGPCNAALVGLEMGDVQVALEIALQLGILARIDVGNGTAVKWARVGRYLHHIDVDPVNRTAKAKP